MISLAPGRASCGGALRGAVPQAMPFDEVLAKVHGGAQEQAAIAFDTCSVFGVAHPTSAPKPATNDPHVRSARETTSPPDLVTPTQQTLAASQAPADAPQPASPRPQPDQSDGCLTPLHGNLPTRTLTASEASVRPFPASAAPDSTRTSQSRSAAKTPVLPTQRLANPHAVAVVIQETELGLHIVARGAALEPDEFVELRSEAEALFMRRGYRIADLDVATAKRE